ncbi:MAG: YfiR/HmsC family protein [Labilithrix sp.]
MRSRRLGAAFLLLFTLLSRPATSDPLPAALQADLVVKVASYDRNLRARAGSNVRVVIAARSTDEDARWSSQIRAALGRTETIAGLPHSEAQVTYTKPGDLASTCRNEHASILIVSSSLLEESASIGRAFDGIDILSAAPDSEMARRGVVLAFELTSGKPKLFLNQSQATKQNVALSAEVMKLMTVYP